MRKEILSVAFRAGGGRVVATDSDNGLNITISKGECSDKSTFTMSTGNWEKFCLAMLDHFYQERLSNRGYLRNDA